MSKLTLGIIEVLGLAAGIVAADTCVKSANVTLVGYEFSKGSGMTTVKVEGDVGAVKAAIQSATVSVNQMSKVVSSKVIARPSDQLEGLIRNTETVGYQEEVKVEILDQDEVLDETPEIEEIENEQVTCNVCGDPKCPRKKGDLRSQCIHY